MAQMNGKRGGCYTNDDVQKIKTLMGKGYKAPRILQEFPGRGLRPLQKLMKEIKGGMSERTLTRNKAVKKENVGLADRLKKDLLESRKSRVHSLRKLAKKHSASKDTISRVLKSELKVKSRKPYRTFKLTEAQAKKRLAWGQKMKSDIMNKKIDLSRIWFSDEKLFRIKDGGKNSQNNRLWVFGEDDPDLLITEEDRFSRGVMVALHVSKMGIGRLIFPPEGVKIDGDTYLSLLEKEVFPDIKFHMKRHQNPGKWVWQQDLAPAHTKKARLQSWRKWPRRTSPGRQRVPISVLLTMEFGGGSMRSWHSIGNTPRSQMKATSVLP